MIPSQRHLFDLPEDIAYLNCAYMAPLMHSVVEAGLRGVRCKARPWEIATPDFFSDPARARGLFARIVNARAEDIAIVPAASYGMAIAARNLPLGAGQTIVLLADQFPSNLYPWRAAAARAGAEIVTVDAPDGDLTAAVLAAIDERTAIAALPHCRWTDGALLDLELIGERVRAAGGALALDLTQSAGALPIDFAKVRPAFAAAACYKWLMGPYTFGFLYVHPDHHHGEPLEYGWSPRAGSEDFTRLVDYRDEYAPGARRYDMGEMSNFHLIPMAIAALDQILAWGVENIAQTLSARTAAIAERARNRPRLAAGAVAGRPLPGAPVRARSSARTARRTRAREGLRERARKLGARHAPSIQHRRGRRAALHGAGTGALRRRLNRRTAIRKAGGRTVVAGGRQPRET